MKQAVVDQGTPAQGGSLHGKVALVTGASRGIGREVALTLSAAGADISVVARNVDALQELAGEIKNRDQRSVLTLQADITSSTDIAAAFAKTVKEFGRLDVAVVNAGIYMPGSFLKMSEEQCREIIETNIFGSLTTIREAGRIMCEQKSGSIIFMGSLYGHIGGNGSSVYCLTKAAIMHLIKSLAVEWARYGVRLNSVCPGWISTDLNELYSRDEKVAEAALAEIPLGRFGTVKDVGPAVSFLASDAASFITGQEIIIDGGQLAR